MSLTTKTHHLRAMLGLPPSPYCVDLYPSPRPPVLSYRAQVEAALFHSPKTYPDQALVVATHRPETPLRSVHLGTSLLSLSNRSNRVRGPPTPV